MTLKKKLAIVCCVAAVAIGLFIWLQFGGSAAQKSPSLDSSVNNVSTNGRAKAESAAKPSPMKKHAATVHTSAAASTDRQPSASQQANEAIQVSSKDETERLVDDFDALTDKWIEPAKDGVAMKDVDSFVERFRKVPQSRKKECLHRALNLVPDENVMLLAGILMDKSQDKEIVETVFSDILNRNELVKKPILQQIFNDREHPCWADTAWILDATGEMPGKGK